MNNNIWFNISQGESSSQLEEIFPRMASCNFKSGGLSGLTNIDNTICVLAPNALSEKFFVFLWFWYHFLIVVVGTNLIFVIAMMFKSTTIRKIYASRYIFKEKMPKNGDEFHKKVRFLIFTPWKFSQKGLIVLTSYSNSKMRCSLMLLVLYNLSNFCLLLKQTNK